MPDVSVHEPFEIIAIASSAGGVAALMRVLSMLPADLPFSLVAVQHLDPRHRSLMAEIMSRHTDLRVKEAEDGDQLMPGTVYIAPPDRHLLVNPDATMTLTKTELVHFVRPSVDLLFENEELQSTNEELQTMNDEMRIRTDDLNQANAYLESILSGIRSAVVVVDNNLNVVLWNQWAVVIAVTDQGHGIDPRDLPQLF